jgi:ribosomal protein S12 methylthiotransferase accessory factor
MSHLNGPYAIQVAGTTPDDDLGRILTEAFNNVLFLPDRVVSNQRSLLAVGVFAGSDDQGVLLFTKSAYDAKIPALCVDFAGDAVLIGSLTLAGRAGCGRCAFERRIAALATSALVAQDTLLPPSAELLKRIAPVILREMRIVVEEGPEQSELLDHLLAVNIDMLDESLHKVIPLAECAVCSGASSLPSLNRESVNFSAEDSPESILEALAGWVDQRTGVISNLFIEPPDDLQIPIIVTAAPPHLLQKDNSLRPLPLGWGKGLSVSGAILSAVGEAIERYSASLVDPARIVWKRPDELEGEFLDPRDCSLYSDAQYERSGFPYARFDNSIQHPWIRGSWADTQQPIWVPALFAVLSIELQQEQSICQGTSNGLAASTDKDDAALRAILELIERDAFMATWLTGRSADRIRLDDTFDPSLRAVLEGVESLGATVEVYSLPTSVMGTTVVCLAIGDGDRYPGITFGLGADLDPRSALRQAVLELGQTGPYLRRMMQSKTLTTPAAPAAVREMLDHAAYYFPPERARAFDRLRFGDTTISLRDLERPVNRSLHECVSALKQAGVRVVLIDVTAPDVATGPFHVMRAVSPDLQPIWYGYGLDRIPVGRIRDLGIAPDLPPINPIW